MPDQPTLDVTAVVAQINVLKQQRDNAMNDVAVLMGQLESAKQQIKDLQNVLKAIPDEESTEKNTLKSEPGVEQGNGFAALEVKPKSPARKSKESS